MRDRDRHLVYASAFVRAVAVGYVGVLAALHLAATGLAGAEVTWVIAAGLAGAAAAAAVVTLAGDRLGRRATLIALALLSAAGAVGFAILPGPVPLALAAFAGMVNGMGRDRGASLILEQAILPATTGDAGRTRAFAAYNIAQDVGHALGAVLAGLPALLRLAGAGDLAASRAAVLVYAGLAVIPALICLRLSAAVEPAVIAPVRLQPASRARITRLAALFGLDSLGGGFLTTALLALFFHQRFGAGEEVLAALFFGARLLNAASHAGAAWLAARIGLVNTMVFTHLPSSLLLATVVIAPSFPVAAVLFLLREGLVEMDVPTRQSYVMAVVRPEERTVAAGITHLVRMGGWAAGPALAGALAGGDLAVALVAGAGLKIVYDLLLYVSFRSIRPPEEARA
ncbi:MAG TPA: MFS transporter [Kofleriaceae bacterium]|nr:MFS transporter [Kofleriaceae bacterium]